MDKRSTVAGQLTRRALQAIAQRDELPCFRGTAALQRGAALIEQGRYSDGLVIADPIVQIVLMREDGAIGLWNTLSLWPSLRAVQPRAICDRHARQRSCRRSAGWRQRGE